MVFYPLTVLLLFWNFSLDWSMAWLPLMGLLTPILAGVLGWVVVQRRYTNPLQQGSYIISAMLSNRGTIGGLALYILLGEIGFAYNQLILLFGPINVYLIAFPVAEYYHSKTIKKTKNQPFSLKQLVLNRNNLPIVGIIIGLCLNFSPLERPEAFSAIIGKFINVYAWCALLPIGASIRFNKVRGHIKNIMSLSILKFLILPILTFIVVFFLLDDPIAQYTLIVTSITPCAINAVVCAKLNHLDVDVAISAFLFTTIIFIFVVFPVVSIITLKWLMPFLV